jgi:hypothetical protein
LRVQACQRVTARMCRRGRGCSAPPTRALWCSRYESFVTPVCGLSLPHQRRRGHRRSHDDRCSSGAGVCCPTIEALAFRRERVRGQYSLHAEAALSAGVLPPRGRSTLARSARLAIAMGTSGGRAGVDLHLPQPRRFRRCRFSRWTCRSTSALTPGCCSSSRSSNRVRLDRRVRLRAEAVLEQRGAARSRDEMDRPRRARASDRATPYKRR